MWTFPFAAWLLGCGAQPSDTGPAHRCIRDYGEDDGYDFVSDGWHQDCSELTAACDPLSVSAAEASCEAPCTVALTRGGAGCIAHEEGFARGIDGVVHADLIYSEAHQRPVWVVSNILADDGTVVSGERLVISAEDASVLERYPWSR